MKCLKLSIIVALLCATVYAEDVATSSDASPAIGDASSTVGSNKKYIISDDIPTCQQKDSNLNDCIKKAFEIMLPRLKDGNKDLNVPAIDPFVLNRTAFEYTNGPVSGRITMKKALVYGLANTKVLDVNFDILEDGQVNYTMSTEIPNLYILGTYKADISLNNVKIRPRGGFNVTLNKMTMKLKTHGKVFEKDGHQFIRVTKIDVNPEIENMSVNATGIFPDPQLNEIVLNVANQYWRDIYRIMLPETRQYWGPLLIDVINNTFSSVPYDILIKNK